MIDPTGLSGDFFDDYDYEFDDYGRASVVDAKDDDYYGDDTEIDFGDDATKDVSGCNGDYFDCFDYDSNMNGVYSGSTDTIKGFDDNNDQNFTETAIIDPKKFKKMNAKQQMEFLKAAQAYGMKLQGTNRGYMASQLRGVVSGMKLGGLFKNDKDFMNITLRDFLNLNENGTMVYDMNKLIDSSNWTEFNSIKSQYHQSNVFENYNAKFVNSDGREIVFNIGRHIDNTYNDKGTFNYSVPSNPAAALDHLLYDMLPYDELMSEKGYSLNKRYDHDNPSTENSELWK